jgi:uncharacterized protein YjlB
MDRRNFLEKLVQLGVGTNLLNAFSAQATTNELSYDVITLLFPTTPQSEPIPNSHLPLVVFKKIFQDQGNQAADRLEKIFKSNGWSNTWRWTLFDYHHYHSNTHEALAVFRGSALLMIGGEKGKEVRIETGDLVIIPAGLGHKLIESYDKFKVMGAYPDGISPDRFTGKTGERPKTDQNIAKVPLPTLDPLGHKTKGLLNYWG